MKFANIESPKVEILFHNWLIISEPKSLEILGIVYRNSTALSNFRCTTSGSSRAPSSPVDTRFSAQSDSIVRGPTVLDFSHNESTEFEFSARCWEISSVKFFSKLNNLFFGYFDPINSFFILKINNFRGGLSDISAKTATLDLISASFLSRNIG